MGFVINLLLSMGVAEQLQQFVDVYNVEGMSKTRTERVNYGGWRLAVSNVGFNIVGSWFDGIPIDTQGPDHSVIPYLRDKVVSVYCHHFIDS